MVSVMNGNFKKSLNISLILALVVFVVSGSLSIIFTKVIDENSKNKFVLKEGEKIDPKGEILSVR